MYEEVEVSAQLHAPPALSTRNQTQVSRHYATSRKVAGSRPDEANEYFQFTNSFRPH
jgi:hypothetical protein